MGLALRVRRTRGPRTGHTNVRNIGRSSRYAREITESYDAIAETHIAERGGRLAVAS